MMRFEDRLGAKLSLAIGVSSFPIDAQRIEHLELRMRPWGFSAEVSFWVVCESDPSEDELFSPFVGHDLVTASLTLGRAFDEPDEQAEEIVVRGLVTDKVVVERAVEEVAAGPVLARRYTVRFEDRAKVLWSQHRPTALYVDATLESLFTDNTFEGLTLEHSWARSSTQRPILALGLGVDGNDASFHDFLFWLLDREGAGVYYDVASDSYQIADEKPSGLGSITIEREEVGELEVVFPPVRRAKVSVLNGYSEATEKKKEVANDDAAEGVRADFLIRSPVPADLGARSTREASRAQQRMAGARLSLARFPSSPVVPNVELSLTGLSANLFVSGKTFRVIGVELAGASLGEQPGVDEGKTARFTLSYDVELEQVSDPVIHRPSFVRPSWPFYVEGKVVSETGEEGEETYQVYQDQATSIDLYRVAVPLFDDKQVIVRFEPMTLGGQFYFPAYKGERVLLALELDQASFAGYLDWRAGARLPLETQGNHILFGKKAASQTSVRHVYEDAKPVLSVRRVSDKDEQTMRIFDGTITMETKENES